MSNGRARIERSGVPPANEGAVSERRRPTTLTAEDTLASTNAQRGPGPIGSSSASLADETLAARFRESGNPETLGLLYARYLELVYGLCLQYLRDGGRAEDAAMDIYEQLHVKLREHTVEHFRPWLYRLARNHCLMILRRSASRLTRDSTSVPVYGGADLADMHYADLRHQEGGDGGGLDHDRLLDALAACTDRLNHTQATCIRRFYLEGASYQELADELGWALSKVRSAIQNGRRNLKLCVERNTSDDER